MNESHQDLPRSQNHRIIFVFCVGVICLFFYAIDYWLISMELDSLSLTEQRHISIVKSVIENLIAGAIAAILLALTYRWIAQWIDPGDRVIEVPSTQITDRLLQNARMTRNYVFIGNTASFVSSSVLPVLAELARISGHPRVVTLFLIDPTSSGAVNSYVGYRARVAKGEYKVSDEQAMWSLPQQMHVETSDEVIAKILATLYIAAFVAQYPGINITIYLRNSFTPFRADISDSEAVLTQESRTESAVAFSSRGHFYGWYQKEADAQKGQGLPFDFTKSRDALRNLALAHPTSSRADLKISLDALLSHFVHLAPLASQIAITTKAATLISRQHNKYR